MLPLRGDRCTTGCEARKNFADQSVSLRADNVRIEVATIHISQEALKVLKMSALKHTTP